MMKQVVVAMMAAVLCAAMAAPARAADAAPLVWGNPEIARKIVSGQGNVLIIGDSLQGHSQKEAYLERWGPDHFGGITLAVGFSGPRFGGVFWPWFTNDWVSSRTIRKPSDSAGPDGLTAITPSRSIHWVFDDVEVPSDNGSILKNRFLDTYIQPYRDEVHFGQSWIPNSNGQIVADTFIYTSPSGLAAGIVMEAWQGTDYQAPPLVSASINAYSATPGIQKVSITLDAGQWDPLQDLHVQFRMIPGTIPTEGSTFVAFSTRFHTSTGLSLTTIAQGGQGVSYFLDEDNCTDENLAGYLAVTETNIAYIWLGGNDWIGDNDPIDEWQGSMEQLLDRYKAAKPDLKFVLISTYDGGYSGTPRQAQALYEISAQRDDVVFLNLFELAGDFEFLNANYLADGVHQNEAGAEYFADLVWDLITEAALVRDSGDFDDDGDVDADDIDLFRYNLGNPMYDLDGDGDCDSDDMDVLIRGLVETSLGVGTEYGDFNLDGLIDKTDLTILATNFGVGTTWAEGNANSDLVIDTTDLAILVTNFGFVASGAVPEPATLFIMGCGAIGLLRRRRPKVRRGGSKIRRGGRA